MMRALTICAVLLLTSCAQDALPTDGDSAFDDAEGIPAHRAVPIQRVPGTVEATNRAHVRAPSATPTSERSAPCPPDMVHSGRFCIDRYEAHLRPVSAAGLGKVHPHNERPRAGVRYRAVNEPGVFPQGYISRVEAKVACREADKRLCSRGEWMLACRGTKALAHDDGTRPCNNGKSHLLLQLFGGGADYEAHFNSPELNVTPGFLAKTGDYESCRSARGAHDMVGNLHEWVSDTVTSSFLAHFEAEGGRQYQHKQVGNGIFMGGFYSTRGELGHGCLFTTVAHDAGYHDYSTGFRCCRATSPAGRSGE